MTADIRHDWSLEALRELHDTPLLELVFRAAAVHRKFHDPAEMQVSKPISTTLAFSMRRSGLTPVE